MESTKESLTKVKNKCEVRICENKINYYCHSHKQCVCRSCYLNFHLECDPVNSIDIKLITEAFDKFQAKVNDVVEYDLNFDLASRFSEGGELIKLYQAQITEIQSELESIASKFNAQKLSATQKDILKSFKEFMNSHLYSQYLRDKDKMNQAGVDIRIYSKQTPVVPASIKSKNKDSPTEHDSALKEKVNKLEDKITKLEGQVVKEKSSTSEIKDTKSQVVTDASQLKTLYMMLGYYSKSILFNETYTLEIDLSEERQFDLIKHFAYSKTKLPNVYGLKISNVPKICGDLKEFFKYCFPDNLKYFCLNFGYKNTVELKYYEDELFNNLYKVQDEIFLYVCRFSDVELVDKFVKSSRNCKKIVTRACFYSILKPCDFSLDPIYLSNNIPFFIKE